MDEKLGQRTPDQHTLTYAENIIATLREPFVVLDKTLRVRTANAAFYRNFHNGQWDIPKLRALLPQILVNSQLKSKPTW